MKTKSIVLYSIIMLISAILLFILIAIDIGTGFIALYMAVNIIILIVITIVYESKY